MKQCILCHAPRVHFVNLEKIYWVCSTCKLIFLDKSLRLSPSKEKSRYETHENSPFDEGYREFLTSVREPLLPLLKKGAKGLDYGCGPGPTLSVLFKEKGFDMKNYDPFFFNEPNFLTIPYDFITCTEAIEHFSDPLKEIRLLVSLLKKGGWLAIKTETWARLIKFRTWYYRKDPTHVIFFSEKTFGWISGKFHLNLEKHPKSVFLLQKN